MRLQSYKVIFLKLYGCYDKKFKVLLIPIHQNDLYYDLFMVAHMYSCNLNKIIVFVFYKSYFTRAILQELFYIACVIR